MPVALCLLYMQSHPGNFIFTHQRRAVYVNKPIDNANFSKNQKQGEDEYLTMQVSLNVWE